MSFLKTVSKAAVIGSIISIMGASTVFAAAFGVVSGNNVNIRSQASTSSQVLGSADQGTEFNVLGKEGNWYSIMYNGNQGYVSAEYFTVNKVEATVVGNGVNIRSGASTDSAVIGSANSGQSVTVTAQNNEWYKLSDNSYISKQYVEGALVDLVTGINNNTTQAASQSGVLQNTYGVVTATSGLNLRSTASTEGAIIDVLPYGEIVDVYSYSATWVKVKTANGTEGYLSADYCAVRTGEKPSRSLSSSKGEQVIAYAKQFLGTPYVWGGTSLTSGVDCSGFVYSVYKNFGVTLNRTSASMASNGVVVSKSQLAAGDLVFFDTTGVNDGGISHVGIYIGNGQYIHASSGSEYCVTISDLNNAYGTSTYVTARRVIR